MRIKNDRDLEIAYGVLNVWKEFMSEDGFTEKRNQHIIDQKREIRRYLRERPERRVGWGEYDYWTELYRLDVSDDAEYEDVKEYFEEWEVCHCYPSQYDCTGQIFTTGYKIFKRHGHWMVYHSYGMDV